MLLTTNISIQIDDTRRAFYRALVLAHEGCTCVKQYVFIMKKTYSGIAPLAYQDILYPR